MTVTISSSSEFVSTGTNGYADTTAVKPLQVRVDPVAQPTSSTNGAAVTAL